MQEKLELLEKVAGTSSRKSEQILPSLLPELAFENEKIRPTDAKHSRVTMVISNEFMDKIQRIQNAKSHQLKGSSMIEVFRVLVEEEIKRDEKKKVSLKKPIAQNQNQTTPCKDTPLTRILPPTPEVRSFKERALKPSQTRYIQRSAYRALYEEAAHRCQFTVPQTGRRCESKYRLQVEYCQPYSLGGSNDLENLQLLCATHNALRARRGFGFGNSGLPLEV